MKISDVFPQIRTETNKVQNKKGASEDAKTTEAAGDTSSPSDRLELSPGSRELQKMQEVLKNTPSTRPDRVQAVKERIDRNEYAIDSYKVADRMLASLITDHVQKKG